MMVLLERSLAPSVSGWYAVNALSLTPVTLSKAFQNLDMKSLSRSEIMSCGRPFSQYHLLKKTSARFSAVIVVFVGIICKSEPNQSVIVRIQWYPSSRGNGLMKSIAIEAQRSSGTGKGCRG